MEELKYWVWLSSLPGVGSVSGERLLKYFKSPENIWNANRSDFGSLELPGRAIIDTIFKPLFRENAEVAVEQLKRFNIKVATIEDKNYPELLRKVYAPPLVLYYKGSIIPDEKIIGVVGSRRATPYGLFEAEHIAYDLAGYGITVASGMARGIDSQAHEGALKRGGRTIAVLGCGLDIVYPPENEQLMHRIIESGAVISEYLPGMQPLPANFPARNRIISGLSMGIAVIEAGDKSGSLITADFAADQGREVFALPGNISSGFSTGTNKLIKDGAKIITEVEDILEELNCFIFENKSTASENNDHSKYKKIKIRLSETLEGDEKKIAECLETETMHVDTLLKATGLSMQTINSLLVIMELKGIIEQLPGKIFKIKE